MVMAGSATSLLVVVVVVMVMVGAQAFSPPRPRRDYCRNRTPSECCRGVRDDHCEVETEDGFCYCDDFCMERYEFKEKKSSHTDCCPDFREVCLGEVPVPEERWLNNTHEHKKSTEETVCYYNDMILKEGKHIFNCNECLCQDSKITCEEDKCLVDEEILGQMKRPDPRLLDWKMTNYSMFWGRKVKEGLPLRTGTLPSDVLMSRMNPILLRPDIQRIPMKFDARVKPEWSGLISGVRDQGWCGASWVFSTLDVTQDRQRILSGASHGSLSTQEVLSCVVPRMECTGGGYISNAWGYIRRHGVMEETCYLYESGNTSTVPACHHKANCKKYKTEPAYRISEKVEDIQWEIMNEGPVQAVMRVYPDFFMYQSGVYHCPKNSDSDTATSSLHSVRIVGWGVHYTNKYNPLKYWVVANSWGTEWGERGFFRIQRGTNECHIESFVLATRGWKNPWLNTATRTQSQGIFATPQ